MPREKTNDSWTEYQTPWVEETDTPFVYRVESRSEFLTHTVDLTQRGGHGACTCQFFTIRANSNFRRHGKFIPYAPKRQGVSECAHIAAARAHYHVNVTIPMLAKFRNGISNP
jgi:hypothetical protein